MFSERISGERYYFIGVGGVSMSALALLLHDRGIAVRGSDCTESDRTRRLKERGIPVYIGEDEEITENCVVYSGAIGDGNSQLSRARRAGKRLISRAELLGNIAEEYPNVFSVAGCHGKTSTTAMLAHVLASAGKPFTCHVGGDDLDFGNYHLEGNEYFVTEACEFRRSFLSLHGGCALVLNVDLDHTDCYRDENEIFLAFSQFASQADKVVVNADDPRARTIRHDASFGLNEGDYRAVCLSSEAERYSFTVTEKGVPLVKVRLNVAGRVHVLNALAVFAAARLYGVTAEEIARGLENFRGVKRRFEKVGFFGGIPVVCDYAHHPREIAAVLDTAQKLCGGTVRLVFQPHTYTRTKDLMDDFAEVLKRAENPIVYKTYAAREAFDGAGSAYALVSRVPEAVYVQSAEQLKKRLSGALKSGDMILVLGAGDIYEIATGILDY